MNEVRKNMSRNLFKRITAVVCMSYALTAYSSDVNALDCSCWDGSGSYEVSHTRCYGRWVISPSDIFDVFGTMFSAGLNLASRCRVMCEEVNEKKLNGKQWVYPYIVDPEEWV